jgi:TPP-dependent 2-oxoacid decarboxylase
MKGFHSLLFKNNDGYTIERMIVEGSFNDLQPWKYSLLPEVFGGQRGTICAECIAYIVYLCLD